MKFPGDRLEFLQSVYIFYDDVLITMQAKQLCPFRTASEPRVKTFTLVKRVLKSFGSIVLFQDSYGSVATFLC